MLELALDLHLLFQTIHCEHQNVQHSENRNTTQFPILIGCYTI